MSHRRLILLLALGAAVAWAPRAASAQDDILRLGAECGGGVGQLTEVCQEALLAVQAAQGALGLATSGGPELSGNASTLGRRFGGMPRLAIGGRVGFSHQGMPEPVSSAPATSTEETFFVTSVQANVAAGLFRGFSPAPTVGGVLSLDVLGSATFLFPPESRGFEESVFAYGAGIRLGVFRESFTLPGVTLSAMRHWTGDVKLGDMPSGAFSSDFDLTVSSIRGTVSKDFVAFGLLAGAGWDRYESDLALTARSDPPGSPTRLGTVSDGELSSERLLFFGGLDYTYLVLQISAQGGFATGYEAIPGRQGREYDPTDGAFFARLGLRITL